MPLTKTQSSYHYFLGGSRFAYYQAVARANGLELEYRHEPGDMGGSTCFRQEGEVEWYEIESSEEAIREELESWGIVIDDIGEIPERKMSDNTEWQPNDGDLKEQELLAASIDTTPGENQWESWCKAATGKAYRWS